MNPLPSIIEVITSIDDYKKYIKLYNQYILFFYTEWYEPCISITEVLQNLISNTTDLIVLKIDAEKLPKLSVVYEIASIPTILYIRDNTQLDKLIGADIPNIVTSYNKFMNIAVAEIVAPKEEFILTPELSKQLGELINSYPIFLFIKGTPEAPKCGFSRELVKILNELNLEYKTFNILDDVTIRSGLKLYSNWKFFPQLYSKGQLVGGLDICKELLASGDLLDALQ